MNGRPSDQIPIRDEETLKRYNVKTLRLHNDKTLWSQDVHGTKFDQISLETDSLHNRALGYLEVNHVLANDGDLRISLAQHDRQFIS